VLVKLSKLQSDKKKLLEELDRHKDCDPEVMEQMKEETSVAREAANRWTGLSVQRYKPDIDAKHIQLVTTGE